MTIGIQYRLRGTDKWEGPDVEYPETSLALLQKDIQLMNHGTIFWGRIVYKDNGEWKEYGIS